jgi:hypothetical protein
MPNTGEPIPDAIVVAEWITSTGTVGGSELVCFHAGTVITNAAGEYYMPAWRGSSAPSHYGHTPPPTPTGTTRPRFALHGAQQCQNRGARKQALNLDSRGGEARIRRNVKFNEIKKSAPRGISPCPPRLDRRLYGVGRRDRSRSSPSPCLGRRSRGPRRESRGGFVGCPRRGSVS